MYCIYVFINCICRVLVGVIKDNFMDNFDIFFFGNVYVCFVDFSLEMECLVLLLLCILGKVFRYNSSSLLVYILYILL